MFGRLTILSILLELEFKNYEVMIRVTHTAILHAFYIMKILAWGHYFNDLDKKRGLGGYA